MKFKVGDRVKVRKDLKNDTFYGGNRVNEEMFMHRGQILTIRAIDGKNYLMEEDNWYWTDEMFEDREEYNYEDLKKIPIGTKITFENGEVLVKDDDGNYDNAKHWREELDLKKLEDAIAFRNVSHMPARVKCALLAWHTIEDILNKNEK